MRRMYSLEQLRALAAFMASEGELDFSNVDLKAKTLEQSQPNWTMPISYAELITGGAELDSEYCRLEKIGNVLYIVVSVTVVNNTEEAVTAGLGVQVVEIPSAIGDKIIDTEGNKVSEAGNANVCHDVSFTGMYGSLTTTYGVVDINHNGANTLRMQGTPSRSLTAGQKCNFSFRTFLTLM